MKERVMRCILHETKHIQNKGIWQNKVAKWKSCCLAVQCNFGVSAQLCSVAMKKTAEVTLS